jgi:phosphonoacetaldehyde hydrolase
MKYEAVIFDWAGTMIDFGSFAPLKAFVKSFEAFNIQVSDEDARIPMGSPKWDHIDTMLKMPHIADAWEKQHGNKPSVTDVDSLYEVFVPLNEEVVAQHSTLVSGAKDMLDDLNARGLKVGSTTGYVRSIMERVLPIAAEQGYEPLNLVCSDDLPVGRPTALGMYKCCVDLGISHVSKLIKVDDTVPGIAEGVNAGTLTVGLALSGNYVGKTPEQLSKLTDQQIDELRSVATEKLKAAGADYVIDTVADLPELLDKLM